VWDGTDTVTGQGTQPVDPQPRTRTSTWPPAGTFSWPHARTFSWPWTVGCPKRLTHAIERGARDDLGTRSAQYDDWDPAAPEFLVAQAQEVLGTKTATETIHAALAEVVARRGQERLFERLRRGDRPGRRGGHGRSVAVAESRGGPIPGGQVGVGSGASSVGRGPAGAVVCRRGARHLGDRSIWSCCSALEAPRTIWPSWRTALPCRGLR
jgi:hypothetical protein